MAARHVPRRYATTVAGAGGAGWPLLLTRIDFLSTGSRASLGAAMATLAASRRPPDMLYTFGSPMVGNGAFGATLKGVAHARFQNCTDIVARIPAGLPGFEHTGTLHYLDRHGKLQLRAGARVVRPDQRIAAFEYFAQWAWRSGSAPLRELADHAPINYVSGALGRRGARTAV